MDNNQQHSRKDTNKYPRPKLSNIDKSSLVLPSQNHKKVPTTVYDTRSMSYPTMFSPNPPSPLYPGNSSSPPQKKSRSNTKLVDDGNNLFSHARSPSNLQPNISYTRGTRQRRDGEDNDNEEGEQDQEEEDDDIEEDDDDEDEDEDQRFLRLARDALVATAQGINHQNRGTVDPTINDLLTRLQYASSPHGNPIKQSKDILSNEKGQLNISEFYESFPNLSNDVFDKSIGNTNEIIDPIKNHHHPSGTEAGWNFLIGEPMVLKSDLERQNTVLPSHNKPSSSEDQHQQKNQPQDPSRKFLCDKCLMSFRRSSDLKRHEKQHLSIPPNICEFCGKGFARKDALKRHVGTLTCKRNADKQLYKDNLDYLQNQRFAGSSYTNHNNNGNVDDDNDEEDEDDEDDEDDDAKPNFPTYGYQTESNDNTNDNGNSKNKW